jgi:hypothetical protein
MRLTHALSIEYLRALQLLSYETEQQIAIRRSAAAPRALTAFGQNALMRNSEKQYRLRRTRIP